MNPYANRTYRNFSSTATVPFQVTIGESDLFIRADRDLTAETLPVLREVRRRIEQAIEKRSEFATSLRPLSDDPEAPEIIAAMLRAGRQTETGPMAAVAGAVAETVGKVLTQHSRRVIIENGGDIYLSLPEDITVGILAGASPFSGRIGLRIRRDQMPCGLCTSSGTVGHSYSEGLADAVTILAADAALSDAAATAVANRVKTKNDVDAALAFGAALPGVMGVCIVIGDKLGVWGELSLEKTA